MSEQITPNPSVPSQVVAEVTFPKFVNALGIIPTSYKDSMSYYECLAWLCKYLEETVIPTVNQNGEAVEELQNLYVELNSYVTNYFDNLDVQEEINNKLDQMVISGSLQTIVYNYFSDITEMVNNLDQELTEEFNTLQTNTNSSISTQNGRIGTLESRMDSFTNLTAGSTTGDAELIDGRIAFDGRTYTNIGENIRFNQGAYWKDISSTLTKVEGKWIRSNYTEATLSAYDYYELETKKGYLYYIDTSTDPSVPQVVYAKSKTIPEILTNEIHKNPIIFEGTGTVIYINTASALTFSVFESLKFNYIDKLNTYYKKLTLDTDYTQTEDAYINNSGNPVGNLYYDYYTISAKKGYKYIFKSFVSDLAPLLYQDKAKPKNGVSGALYNWGYYEYIATSSSDILINVSKSNVPLGDGFEIYESLLPIFVDNQILKSFNGIISNAVFCGDSLTYGQTYTSASETYRNYFNYPYYVKKLMQIDTIEEYANPGATTTSWWTLHQNDITSSNSVYFVWLGTNSQMTDTVATDCAGDDYTQFTDNETGNLGKILGKIASLDNNKIVILNNFATVGTLAINNKVISELATKYNAILVDVNTNEITNSDYHTSYNNYYNSVHFNSAGHNYVANLVKDTLIENLNSSPDLLEVYKVHD